jgi:hypothetical protein
MIAYSYAKKGILKILGGRGSGVNYFRTTGMRRAKKCFAGGLLESCRPPPNRWLGDSVLIKHVSARMKRNPPAKGAKKRERRNVIFSSFAFFRAFRGLDSSAYSHSIVLGGLDEIS